MRRVLLNFLNNIEDFCPEDMIEDATDPVNRLCGYKMLSTVRAFG